MAPADANYLWGAQRVAREIELEERITLGASPLLGGFVSSTDGDCTEMRSRLECLEEDFKFPQSMIELQSVEVFRDLRLISVNESRDWSGIVEKLSQTLRENCSSLNRYLKRRFWGTRCGILVFDALNHLRWRSRWGKYGNGITSRVLATRLWNPSIEPHICDF